MSKSQTSVLIAICLIGFGLRACYCLIVGDDLEFPDENRFLEEALSLLESGVLIWKDEYAHDMPATPFFIAGIMKVTGGGVLVVRLVFAAISSVTIFYIARLTSLFTENSKAPLFAAAAAAIYPFFIFYSALLLSETLFLLVLTAYFYYLLRSLSFDHLLVGGIGGIVHLVRPSLYYFFPVIWCIQKFVLGYPFRKATITLLLTIAVILPWGVRNSNIFDKVILGTTGVGQVLWEGNNPYNPDGVTSGEFMGVHGENDYLEKMPPGLNELERDQWKKQQALSYIKDNPLSFVKLSVKRFLRFWNILPNHPDFRKPFYIIISLLSYGVVLLGFLLGFWVFRRRLQLLVPILLFFSYYSLIHVISIGSLRYRLPLEPIMISMAVAAFVELFENTGFKWVKKEPV